MRQLCSRFDVIICQSIFENIVHLFIKRGSNLGKKIENNHDEKQDYFFAFNTRLCFWGGANTPTLQKWEKAEIRSNYAFHHSWNIKHTIHTTEA